MRGPLRTMPADGHLSRTLCTAAAALLAAVIAAGCGGNENASRYEVTVSVFGTTRLNSLHFALRSYFNDGDWIGHGDKLECTVLVNAALSSKHFGFDPGKGAELEIQLQSDPGVSFAGTGQVIRCALRTAETMRDVTECSNPPPDNASLCVEFFDATDFTGSPINATVAITDVSLVP